MINVREVTERVQAVRAEITQHGGSHVALIAVTKTFGYDAMVAAHEAGCDGVGENYAQELVAKVAEFPAPLPVHFIGNIQTNKVKSLVPIVSLWQTVDRPSVITELARRAPGAHVLLQVNTTGEESKSGMAPGDLDALRSQAEGAGLHVEGLMTIGPTHGARDDVEAAFGFLRRLVDQHHLSVCSMGMSDDFAVAVSCGSTMVRVGSRLFGPRQ